MFESQTQTEYCVQRGSYQNQECANGLINGREKWENRIPSGAKHTSAKEEVKAESGLKQWKLNAISPGSTKLGCTATLQARLLSTAKGDICEVTVPRYSAHCGHDVGSLPDLLTHKPLPEIEKVETLVRHSRLS